MSVGVWTDTFQPLNSHRPFADYTVTGSEENRTSDLFHRLRHCFKCRGCGYIFSKICKKNLVTYLVSYQKSSLPVMRTKKKSPLSPICFAMRHRAQFTVSPSQNCSSSTISIKRAGGGFTHQQKNLDRQVWQKRGVGRIPLFVHITVILSAVSVLTLLPPYLSFSQPAKCAKWSQVSACPCRVNECMNNR